MLLRSLTIPVALPTPAVALPNVQPSSQSRQDSQVEVAQQVESLVASASKHIEEMSPGQLDRFWSAVSAFQSPQGPKLRPWVEARVLQLVQGDQQAETAPFLSSLLASFSKFGSSFPKQPGISPQCLTAILTAVETQAGQSAPPVSLFSGYSLLVLAKAPEGDPETFRRHAAALRPGILRMVSNKMGTWDMTARIMYAHAVAGQPLGESRWARATSALRPPQLRRAATSPGEPRAGYA